MANKTPLTELSQEEIQKCNVLIAEFEVRKFWGKTIDRFGPTTGNHYPKMRYHEDWNWIMAVIDKIDFTVDYANEPMYTTIEQGNCEIKNLSGSFCVCYGESNKLFSVWSMVVDFVKWHNKKAVDATTITNP